MLYHQSPIQIVGAMANPAVIIVPTSAVVDKTLPPEPKLNGSGAVALITAGWNAKWMC